MTEPAGNDTRVECGYCHARFRDSDALGRHYRHAAELAQANSDLDEHDGVPPIPCPGQSLAEVPPMTPDLAQAMAMVVGGFPLYLGLGETPSEYSIVAWLDKALVGSDFTSSQREVLWTIAHAIAVIQLTTLAKVMEATS